MLPVILNVLVGVPDEHRRALVEAVWWLFSPKASRLWQGRPLKALERSDVDLMAQAPGGGLCASVLREMRGLQGTEGVEWPGLVLDGVDMGSGGEDPSFSVSSSRPEGGVLVAEMCRVLFERLEAPEGTARIRSSQDAGVGADASLIEVLDQRIHLGKAQPGGAPWPKGFIGGWAVDGDSEPDLISALTLDEAVLMHLDGSAIQVESEAEWAEQGVLKVVGYRWGLPLRPSRGLLAEKLLDWLYEGAHSIDYSEPSAEMLAAEEVFADAVMRDPDAPRVLVPVTVERVNPLDWVREHAPDWIVDEAEPDGSPSP